MLTTIDPQIYSPDEYNIVALPSEVLKQRTIDIQSQLLHIFGDAIWLTPPHALHMTVIEITGPHTQPVALREERYQKWQRNYGQVTQDTIASLSPISLHFNQLLVSERAIILKAENPDPLNALRHTMLSKMKLPEGTNLPPDIAHISVARFNKAIDLDKAIHNIETLTINCTEPVTGFLLLKGITPPSFNIETIHTYPLCG